jgi:phosphatidylserine/phosphatidylglycerophosphate/cardiolipin synthase-like enzyme
MRSFWMALLFAFPVFAFSDTIVDVFFSSEEHIDDRLIQMIKEEKEEIRTAIYQITSKKIADALIDAQKRGVVVKLVTSRDAGSKAYYKLKESPVEIKLYQAVGAMDRGLLHHKFAIFKKNKDDKSYVWTGSANWTQTGCHQNRENVVVIEGTETYAKFLKEFDSL